MIHMHGLRGSNLVLASRVAFSGDFLWEQAAKGSSQKTLVISDGARAA